MAKPTLEKFESGIWWWRKKHWNGIETLLGAGRLSAYDERAAFKYELVRRCNRKKRFVSFLALRPKRVSFLESIFGEYAGKPLPSRHNPHPELNQEHGWTPTNGLLQWNLTLPDETLKRDFIRYINQNRESQKITRPKRVPGKIKPIPWRWLELMDCAEFGLCKLSDSERHGLAEARKKAKYYSEQFFAKLSEPPDNTLPPNFDSSFDEDSLGLDLESQLAGKTAPMWKGIWPCEESNQR